MFNPVQREGNSRRRTSQWNRGRARVGGWRGLLMVAVVLASGVVGSVVVDAAGPAPASAAVYYGVSMETQCSRQYGWNAHAAWINGANPYSWFCFRWGGGSMTVGFPSGISATVEITPIGGIDVGSYCRWKYGTIFRPVIINYNVWAWRCTA